MSETALTRDQEARAAALREANYYFGFVAQVKRPEGLQPGEPTIRAREVIALADAFFDFIKTGKKPVVTD